MHQDLLPSGQVSYFPMAEYQGDGRFRTLAGGDHTVHVRKRVVDATYLQTTVPSMRPPAYDVADGVDCVPPNDMPAFAVDRERFVIVGAGKTGIDACLWLLRNGIPPERLTWIMPRDSWLMDRANIQPGPQFLERFQAGFAQRLVAIDAATIGGRPVRTVGSLRQSAAAGLVGAADHVSLRERDEDRTSNSCNASATSCGWDASSASSPARWCWPTARSRVDGSALYVDCSADGLEKRAPITVFDGDRITLQSVRGCQQVFSSGLIAHVEAGYGDDATRNRLCQPVPHPNTDLDWLTTTLAEQRNQISWFEDPDLMDWLCVARLDLMRHMYAPLIGKSQEVRDKVFGLITAGLRSANEKLDALLSEHLSPLPQAAEASR